MKHLVKIFCLGAALVAAPLLAHATPITGSIGFSGNGSYSGNQFTAGGNVSGTSANGYVNAPSAPGTTLAAFSNFNPATFYSFNTSTYAAGGNPVFTTTQNNVTLSFVLTSMIANVPGSAGGGFTGMGILSESGYDNTTATFSLGTNSGAGTFLTFNTTAAQTPEPSSLVLLGSGLLSAAGMVARRRRV